MLAHTHKRLSFLIIKIKLGNELLSTMFFFSRLLNVTNNKKNNSFRKWTKCTIKITDENQNIVVIAGALADKVGLPPVYQRWKYFLYECDVIKLVTLMLTWKLLINTFFHVQKDGSTCTWFFHYCVQPYKKRLRDKCNVRN